MRETNIRFDANYLEMILRFVDIGGIVDHHCLSVLYIIRNFKFQLSIYIMNYISVETLTTSRMIPRGANNPGNRDIRPMIVIKT